MERCPVCRAPFKHDPVCYRCGADLSVLLAIEAEATRLERQAVNLLGGGELLKAYQTAEHALKLQRSLLTLAVRNFARQELIATEARLFERLLQ